MTTIEVAVLLIFSYVNPRAFPVKEAQAVTNPGSPRTHQKVQAGWDIKVKEVLCTFLQGPSFYVQREICKRQFPMTKELFLMYQTKLTISR